MKYYIDKNQIERLASNKDAYRRGVNYFHEGRVKEIEFTEAGENSIVGVVVEGVSSEYKVNVAFDKIGVLKKYSCTCSAFGVWRGGCKHVVAGMLKLFELNSKQAVLSKVLRTSQVLLKQYEEQVYRDIDVSVNDKAEPLNQVNFAPVFNIYKYGEAFLTFKIGRKKKYIVKNIASFLEDVKKEAVVSYGKELEFEHKLTHFDDQSATLIQLLDRDMEHYKKVGKFLNGQFYNVDTKFKGREMPVSEELIDRFFEIYQNSEIEAAFCDCLLLCGDRPDFRFDINMLPEGIELSLKNCPENINYFKGEKYNYLLDTTCLHRLEGNYARAVCPIVEAMNVLGKKTLIFPKADIDKFKSFLLPKLREFDLVNENMEFSQKFVSFRLQINAYFDILAGDVTCSVIYEYGGEEFDPYTKNEPEHMTRDIAGEYRFKSMLARMGFIYSSKTGCPVLSGDDLIYDFYYSPAGLAEIQNVAQVFATDEFKRITLRQKAAPSMGIRINGGLLEVSIDAGDYSGQELIEILESYKIKKKYHKLKDGSFIDFGKNKSGFEAFYDMAGGLSLTDKEISRGYAEVPKYRALYANEVINSTEMSVETDEKFNQLIHDFKTYKELDFEAPKSVNKIMRGYQKEGFKWLKTLSYYGFGGILADDMGLGKTLQVIAVLLSEKGKSENPSIAVVPTSLIYNWESEVKKFAPALTTCVIAGTASRREEIIKSTENVDLFITTYDMLKRDIDCYKDIMFSYIIADEAQNIKNPATQNAKSLKMLNGKVKYALTGTPIENSLTELWSIFDFIMSGYLYHLAKFNKLYETPIIKDEDENAAADLKRQIEPFILRRIKKDVLKELPDKIESTLFAEMPPEQKKLYTAFLMKAKGELEETIEAGKYKESQIEILSKLTRLRQICCHPSVFAENYVGGSGKLDLTMETVKNSVESGHRVLIFSQFTKMLDIIKLSLDKEGITYFYLDGATQSRERLLMADRFNGGENNVFLISLKAGGTGLNLIGADVVIHYDPWWNPAVMNQASDRAHRFGQKKTVQVFNIVAKDSIEEKIIELQAKKKEIADAVINEGASFINKMSEDDVLALFK